MKVIDMLFNISVVGLRILFFLLHNILKISQANIYKFVGLLTCLKEQIRANWYIHT